MNKTISTLCLAIALLICGCKSDSEKLHEALKDLTPMPLSSAKTDSLRYLVAERSDLGFPVYAPNGDILSLNDIKKQKINMTVDGFTDNTGAIKAVVFRPQTEDEVAKTMATEDTLQAQKQKSVDSLSTTFAPVFAAKDVNNESLDLTKLRGKVVVLNFWFIRCHGCVQEMPELNEIKAEFKNKNVEFIGLTFDKEDEVKAFLQRTKFDYKIIAEAQKIFDQFNITACPVSIVINEEGKIMYTGLGYEEKDKLSQIQLRKALNKVLDKDKP
jgi:peroxiredoxin